MSPSPRATEHLAIDPAFAPTLRAHGLDALDALMRVAGDADLDKPGLARWRQRVRLELDGAVFFIKRYRRPPWREQLRARAGGFAAIGAIEWHWLHRLRAAGVPAAAPVAMGYRRRFGLERASVLVTAAVPGRSLEHWAAAHRASPLPWLRDRHPRLALLDRVAELVSRLHAEGLFHRDLYLSHVFFDPDAEPTAALALIDLQRVVRPRWCPGRWRVKDLAALHYSTPAAAVSSVDQLRWLKRYRGVERLTPADKRLARRVIAKTRRIARHDRRRKRAVGRSATMTG